MEQALNDKSGKPMFKFRNTNLAQAWLVLVLAMGFGAALAAVEVNLSSIIAANKQNETLEKIPEIVGKSAPHETPADGTIDIKATPGSVRVQKEGNTKVYPVYRATYQGKPAGWVIKAGGQGYAGNIELLMGLDPAAEVITGLFILEQKETPGLGDKITVADWRKQFIGKDAGIPLRTVKGQSTTTADNGIDVITGATISSRAVTAIVNKTMGDMKGRLRPPNVQFMERQK